MKLIHVTRLECLESILTNGLHYSVSREILDHVNYEIGNEAPRSGTFYIPMISFYGMTINEHLQIPQSYGNCGIILNPNYQQKNLNPVRYINRYSLLASRIANYDDYLDSINEGIVNSALTGGGQGFRVESIKMYMENILYSKSFIGPLNRRNIDTNKYEEINPDYHFGLEREWRLIPEEIYSNLRIIKDVEPRNIHYGNLVIRDSIYGFITDSEENKSNLCEELIRQDLNPDEYYIGICTNYGQNPQNQ